MSHVRLHISHWLAELFDSRLPYFKGARQLRNVLTNLLSPKLSPPQIISTRYGFDIKVTTDSDSIDYHLYTRGTYEAGTLNIISKCLHEGDVFIDVGANIGLMSLLGATRVGKSGAVYAFEPEPYTFNLLQNNMALNQTNNIQAMNFGLGAVQGAGMIYMNSHDNRGMASFLESGAGVGEGVEVPVLTLDTFLAEQAVGTVRMMKVDVEGWELEVLKGAQTLLNSPEAPILCVEYNTIFPLHRKIYNLITTINNYQIFILEHSNWYVSPLLRVKSDDELPSTGSPNLFCFLPMHLQNLDGAIFKD